MALSVNIEKNLGAFQLNVSFEAANNTVALLGASGSGKSMTLKCIAGIERPDFGRIVLDDKVLFDSERRINLSPRERHVGYLFQQYALFPNMSTEKNIACGIRNKKERKTRVPEIIHAMQLDGLENKKPYQLSGGQQQRVALARILVNDPDVLLLDEPFSALDSHLRFQLERDLYQYTKNFGKTIIMVSHDRDEVFRLADDISIIHNGRSETFGPKHSVFNNPKTVNGAQLTGCKNISPVTILDDLHVYAVNWGITLEVPNVPQNTKYAGIRLHDIMLDGTKNRILCDVREVIENPFSYTIMLSYGTLDNDLFGITLDKQEWQRIAADKIEVSLPPEHILLLSED